MTTRNIQRTSNQHQAEIQDHAVSLQTPENFYSQRKNSGSSGENSFLTYSSRNFQFLTFENLADFRQFSLVQFIARQFSWVSHDVSMRF